MIVLYSSHCPKCEILKKKLEEQNIEFEENNDIGEMIDKGFMSAPMLDVNGEVMDYVKAFKWVTNYNN